MYGQIYKCSYKNYSYTHRKIEINIHTCMHTIMNIILVNCNVLEITGDH